MTKPPGERLETAATQELAPGDQPQVVGELVLERGHGVGRYLIVDRIGAGGMSVVYRAYDPELDRAVAVKVMRTRYWEADGQLRILREAQAMARLAHPNVVTIHDVGELGDQLFIAMELVDGVTLDAWQEAEPRTWPEVRDVLVQVGRGLAAAHAAGIVHRDVKPSNVLVDRTGRARIGDFGIARALGADEPELAAPAASPDGTEPPGASSSRRVLGASFTRAGALVGTPGYMAPEQRQGSADERSDQYAFCAMALRALVPPEGADADAPAGVPAGTPAWLRAVLQRGRAADPAARYPSMDALLQGMTFDPSARRRRLASIALLAALFVGAGFGAYALRGRGPHGPAPCQGAAELLRGVWDEPTAAAVARSFAATGRAHAADSAARVKRQLDARAAAWVAMRSEACAATQVRREQSERLLDLRMQCLDRRLAEMKALTALFATQADGEVVDRAVQAVAGLADLGPCADAAGLLAAYPPPTDPTQRAEAAALRRRLDEAQALKASGKHKQGLALAQPLAADAARLGWPPLEAEALYVLGHLQSYTGESKTGEATLGRAIQRGADARDDALAARAGTELIYVVGYEDARPKDALAIATLVDALVRRAGDPPGLRGRFLEYVGIVLWSKGEFAAALGYFERALPLLAKAHGADALELAPIHTNLGNALADLKRHDAARTQHERALALTERAAGPDHPHAAKARANLGVVFKDLGRHDEARRAFQRALQTFVATYGPEHAMVAWVENNLGEVYSSLSDHAQALPHCQRALAIGKAKLPPQHPAQRFHHLCVAKALTGLGRTDEAIDVHEAALKLGGSADPTDRADSEFALARALWGRPASRPRAVELAAKARVTLAAAGARGADSVKVIDDWLRARKGAGAKP
jgi:tetratricopeptide (TPR) repeat protein